ncbi:hypothetical protein ACRRTK_005640 [Alexandromys fortis]
MFAKIKFRRFSLDADFYTVLCSVVLDADFYTDLQWYWMLTSTLSSAVVLDADFYTDLQWYWMLTSTLSSAVVLDADFYTDLQWYWMLTSTLSSAVRAPTSFPDHREKRLANFLWVTLWDLGIISSVSGISRALSRFPLCALFVSPTHVFTPTERQAGLEARQVDLRFPSSSQSLALFNNTVAPVEMGNRD